MEITDMKQIDKIEEYFFEARRSAFLISLLCFIGTGVSLTALNALDPALGIVIPILALIVIILFTLFFLLLAFRLFQPIREIVMMVDKLYTDIMKDEELEPVGAETEREKLAELTQQIRSLKKEISVLKEQVPSVEEKQVPSAEKRDWFWMMLILRWASVIVLICAVMFIIIPNALSVFLTVVGIIGITIIALAHARNKGRLKRPRRPKRLGGDEK